MITKLKMMGLKPQLFSLPPVLSLKNTPCAPHEATLTPNSPLEPRLTRHPMHLPLQPTLHLWNHQLAQPLRRNPQLPLPPTLIQRLSPAQRRPTQIKRIKKVCEFVHDDGIRPAAFLLVVAVDEAAQRGHLVPLDDGPAEGVRVDHGGPGVPVPSRLRAEQGFERRPGVTQMPDYVGLRGAEGAARVRAGDAACGLVEEEGGGAFVDDEGFFIDRALEAVRDRRTFG